MGVVDLAADADGNEVALKRLSLHGTPEDVARARARIRREAAVMASLDHPGIVPLIELIDDGDDVVLVMPYLSGGSLYDRVVKTGPLGPDEVMSIADRLLDALAAAHRQGVVHRDIKPENVLFTVDGQPRLVDFGVARTTEHTPGLTATSMVVGTPGFMAPEQARGEPASAAADVFSLAATLLFAVTGEGPFGPPGMDPRLLMNRSAAGRVARVPRDLPPDLRALLHAGLQKHPARRPSAAGLRGGPQGTNPLTSAVAAVGRHRVPAAVAVGLVVVLLLIGVVAVVRGDDDAVEPPAPRRTTSTTTQTTAPPCVPRRYQPCRDGALARAAPNTDGRACLASFEDYDEDTTNGCEAESDGLPAFATLTERAREIEATIVPRDETDTFRLPADDDFDLTCSGEVTVILIAPRGMVLEMTVVRDDDTVTATVLAEDGARGVARVGERCGRSDGDLVVTVRPVGSDRTGASYILRREGSF
jgi:hypothetical protein